HESQSCIKMSANRCSFKEPCDTVTVLVLLVLIIIHLICYPALLWCSGFCVKRRRKWYHWRLLYVHSAVSVLAWLALLIIYPTSSTTMLGTFAWFIGSIIHLTLCLVYNRFIENQSLSTDSIEKIVIDNLPTEPKVITQCEAVEPLTSCCRKQRVIWSNQKEFEFQHWIDVTEQHLVKSQIEEAIFIELKIEFEFDDEETKESYEQHVQNLVKEAKQHSPNAQVNIKQIFQVGEKDIKTYRRSFYGKKALFGRPCACLQCIFPQIELSFKILKRFLEKFGLKSLLTKEIVIRKVISDRNIVAV
uniref:Uncharacterized protein n=1 Tax=Clytia hemisphaerica TaxID=252671 RepID=A0A7M5WTT1_9CNID